MRSVLCHTGRESSSKKDRNPRVEHGIRNHANVILEGPVQLTTNLQTQNRYVFLFDDSLILTKQKSSAPANYRLKLRVRVSEIWIASCLDEVSEVVRHPERSIVIGWPTTNMVATFKTTETKDVWLRKLMECIGAEKVKEIPPSVLLKIVKRDKSCSIMKTVLVSNTEDALQVTERCVQEFHITDGASGDYQLWVLSEDKHDSPYPLIGHERPYSIRMGYLRDQRALSGPRIKGETRTRLNISCSTVNDADPNKGVTFQILSREKCKRFANRQLSLDDSDCSSKKSTPIAKLWKRASHRPASKHRLFGRHLSELCRQGTFRAPIMQMLTHLFMHGPSTPGIFRKSAAYAKCREAKARLNSGHELNFADLSVHVTASLLKELLRCLPDCLLTCRLYSRWFDAGLLADPTVRCRQIYSLLQQLPLHNLQLLRHIVCILSHIITRSATNQMTSHNLSVCVAPCLLWPPNGLHSQEGAAGRLDDTHKLNLLVKYMLDNAVEIFGRECLALFGAVRQIEQGAGQEGCDSDGVDSEGADDSMMSILDHDVYGSDADLLRCSAAQNLQRQVKDKLSPKSMSYDSGLTASNPQLYDNCSPTQFSMSTGVIGSRKVYSSGSLDETPSMDGLEEDFASAVFDVDGEAAVSRSIECLSTPVSYTAMSRRRTSSVGNLNESMKMGETFIQPYEEEANVGCVEVDDTHDGDINRSLTMCGQKSLACLDFSSDSIMSTQEISSSPADGEESSLAERQDRFRSDTEDDLLDSEQLSISCPIQEPGSIRKDKSPTVSPDTDESKLSGSLSGYQNRNCRSLELSSSRMAWMGTGSVDNVSTLSNGYSNDRKPLKTQPLNASSPMLTVSSNRESIRYTFVNDRTRAACFVRRKLCPDEPNAIQYPALRVAHKRADVSGLNINSFSNCVENRTSVIESSGASNTSLGLGLNLQGQDTYTTSSPHLIADKSPIVICSAPKKSQCSPANKLELDRHSGSLRPTLLGGLPEPLSARSITIRGLRARLGIGVGRLHPGRPPTYEEALERRAMQQGNLSTLERRDKRGALATLLYDTPWSPHSIQPTDSSFKRSKRAVSGGSDNNS